MRLWRNADDVAGINPALPVKRGKTTEDRAGRLDLEEKSFNHGVHGGTHRRQRLWWAGGGIKNTESCVYFAANPRTDCAAKIRNCSVGKRKRRLLREAHYKLLFLLLIASQAPRALQIACSDDANAAWL